MGQIQWSALPLSSGFEPVYLFRSVGHAGYTLPRLQHPTPITYRLINYGMKANPSQPKNVACTSILNIWASHFCIFSPCCAPMPWRSCIGRKAVQGSTPMRNCHAEHAALSHAGTRCCEAHYNLRGFKLDYIQHFDFAGIL